MLSKIKVKIRACCPPGTDVPEAQVGPHQGLVAGGARAGRGSRAHQRQPSQVPTPVRQFVGAFKSRGPHCPVPNALAGDPGCTNAVPIRSLLRQAVGLEKLAACGVGCRCKAVESCWISYRHLARSVK